MATQTEAASAAIAAQDGRVPFALRIGVTGHRTLAIEQDLGRMVREALTRLAGLAATSPATPVSLVVVSALAEGADRLVAHEALKLDGARLEAVLPLPAEDYERDFESEDSRREFRELLDRASDVWETPPARDRDEAYELAGRSVVERSDAVIALWDGEPSRGRGGTAEIVGYVRERGVPMIWVDTAAVAAIAEELPDEPIAVLRDAAHELDRFNRGVVPAAQFQAQERAQRAAWELDHSSDPALARLPLEPAAAPLLPTFVRADLLALRFQRRFNVLSAAILLMAASASAAVATQTNFFPTQKWIEGIEVAMLIGILSVLWFGRRGRLHERWISCRFLAERLRSLYFLTLAGTGDRRERSSRLASFTDPQELWIERVLAGVAANRSLVAVNPGELEPLRRYLATHWIGDQLRYHGRASLVHRRTDRALVRATVVLFALTLGTALLHMLGVGANGGHESNLGSVLVVLSISVPVIGAAAHGIRTQRQFRRHSDRYGRMAKFLEQLRRDMERASSLDEVRRIAAETERVMREENSDWFGVMRFHDIELIT